jgi:hypothetical protein
MPPQQWLTATYFPGWPSVFISSTCPVSSAAPISDTRVGKDYTLYAKPDHRNLAFYRHGIAGTQPREDQRFVSCQGKRQREVGIGAFVP